MSKLTKEDCIKIGFKELSHYTVAGSLIYDIGRCRHLSIGSIGTPNEMLFICESDQEDYRKITDLICLHNYDYDGYLSVEKLVQLINSIGPGQKITK